MPATPLAGGASPAVVDVADPAAVVALVDGLDALHDLVVTANKPGGGRVADLDPSVVERTVGVKLLGQLWAARAAAPRLPADGSITLTAGVARTGRVPGTAVTALINGGRRGPRARPRGRARAGAGERRLARHHRHPCVGAPRRRRAEGVPAPVGGGLPVGRVGRPEEVAEGMLALLVNGFATGATLPIDGGGRIA